MIYFHIDLHKFAGLQLPDNTLCVNAFTANNAEFMPRVTALFSDVDYPSENATVQ